MLLKNDGNYFCCCCCCCYVVLPIDVRRCSAQDELSAEDFLSAVKGTYQWRQPSLAAVYHVWKESGPALIASMKEHALSVGQVGSSIHCLELFVVRTWVHLGGGGGGGG